MMCLSSNLMKEQWRQRQHARQRERRENHHPPAKSPTAAVARDSGEAVTEVEMPSPERQPICGVSLEQYAELLALMSEVCEDQEACLRIAEANGVARENWQVADTGWQARTTSGAESPVGRLLLKLYAAALHRKTCGVAPIRLEVFAQVFAALSRCHTPHDSTVEIKRQAVLREHHLTAAQWNAALAYWMPQVSDRNHPLAAYYLGLLRTAATKDAVSPAPTHSRPLPERLLTCLLTAFSRYLKPVQLKAW